jgi:hypothetical protein
LKKLPQLDLTKAEVPFAKTQRDHGVLAGVVRDLKRMLQIEAGLIATPAVYLLFHLRS